MPNSLNGQMPTQRQEEELTASTPAIATDDWSFATKELLDTLPQVWTRGLLYFLVVFVSIVLPWAILFKVDETGTAKGRLEPKGKTVRLDAAVAGTVKEIKVNEGDKVAAGQSLLVLESDLVTAELQQVQDKLEGQLNRLSQLDLLKKQLVVALATQDQQNQAQALEKRVQIDQAQQNIDALRNSSDLQKQEKLAQVEQAQQNLKLNQTSAEIIETRLANAQREVERYRDAMEAGIVSEIQVVDREDMVQERQGLYEQAKSDMEQGKLRLAEQRSSYQRTIQQVKADIEQAELRLKEQERSYQSLTHSGKLAVLKIEEQLNNLETERATLKAEVAQSKRQIESLKFQLEQRIIEAPLKGTLFELPIPGAGAVVQQGTTIAEIAPEDSALVVRAQMATNESGSLREGLAVKLKFDAYPFQDYGVVEGTLTEISPTSKVTETEQGQVASYDLEIELKQDCMPTANKCVPLRPGDTATAEVIVRQRRIIDFILDPFKKLQQGGLKL
ncbi:MAG: HlyD family efflux transporter periplasmic adaptor subunit [Coleofasciculus sp. G1-WW12-02]|uniref:HlyD family efflux transporter periplasmic adaptor subunit n=1 Tax=Coleofasciculus sp. G1-WW12-02 TaxID=3068483 RepID=UPI0032FDC191